MNYYTVSISGIHKRTLREILELASKGIIWERGSRSGELTEQQEERYRFLQIILNKIYTVLKERRSNQWHTINEIQDAS